MLWGMARQWGGFPSQLTMGLGKRHERAQRVRGRTQPKMDFSAFVTFDVDFVFEVSQDKSNTVHEVEVLQTLL